MKQSLSLSLSLSLCRLAAPGLFSCLVALGHAGTLAQEKITEQGPYVGKLAGREVVARFSSDAQGMPMPGSYFYRDTGREVVLFYDAAQRRFIECMPTWQEEETVSGCGEPGGYWDVHVMRNAVLVDWRARADDRPLRAVLTKADPLPGNADLDAQVDALLLAGPRLAGPEQGQGAVRWRMMTEPRSKVSMPFLTRAPVAAAMRRINASLERRFQGQIREVLFNTSRVHGEAEFYNTVFVTGARYFAVGEGAYSESGGAHGNFNFSATAFDLTNGQPVNLARRYHIHPFQRAGMNTDGLSLMEQARAQHQTAAFSHQKASYWKDGINCWGTGQETDGDSKTDPGGMSDAAESGSDESTHWTIFPAEDGLAIAYNGFAESMRYCRADYRVIPWPQAARARRLPAASGNKPSPRQAPGPCRPEPLNHPRPASTAPPPPSHTPRSFPLPACR